MRVITHPQHGYNISEVERALSILLGAFVATSGLRRRGSSGALLALAGSEMIRRGATGKCYLYQAFGISTARTGQGAESTSLAYPLGIGVEEAIQINVPPEEVYRFWRDLENLPRFMWHLESVTAFEPNRSHWIARGPAGRRFEWDAEIINDVPNQLIAWRSIGGDVQNAGSVQFKPSGSGTEVRVKLQYNPPAGVVGAAFAWLFGQEPSQQIREELGRLKTALEQGTPLSPPLAGEARRFENEARSIEDQHEAR
jgi:uncharacterized membrane protein